MHSPTFALSPSHTLSLSPPCSFFSFCVIYINFHHLLKYIYCDLVQGLTCLNCLSSSPVLRLARFLEGAFCKAAASRLAVPFMRPLLPLPRDHFQDHSLSASSSSSSSSFLKNSIGYNEHSASAEEGEGEGEPLSVAAEAPVDLLHILEKVYPTRPIPSHPFMNLLT